MSEPIDNLTEQGARDLAAKINAVWAERGVKAKARVVQIALPYASVQHRSFFCVRSELRFDGARRLP